MCGGRVERTHSRRGQRLGVSARRARSPRSAGRFIQGLAQGRGPPQPPFGRGDHRDLLRLMAWRHVPVEVLLTSNAPGLGVTARNTPSRCTGDTTSRLSWPPTTPASSGPTSAASARAALTYQLDYRALKDLGRTSVEYGFTLSVPLNGNSAPGRQGPSPAPPTRSSKPHDDPAPTRRTSRSPLTHRPGTPRPECCSSVNAEVTSWAVWFATGG